LAHPHSPCFIPINAKFLPAQEHGQDGNYTGNNALEDQSSHHVSRRIAVLIRSLGISQKPKDNDENGAEKLTASPAGHRRYLWTDWMGYFGEVFQRHRDEDERGSTKYGEDDEGGHEGAGSRGEDEGKIADGNNRGKNLDEEGVFVNPVHDGREDGGSGETNENEESTGNASISLRVAVRTEKLVEERRRGIEKADVDAEWDEQEVEGGAV